MSKNTWQTPYWPKDVAREITDYNFPLFELLDRSARKYPDNIFTIFAGASKTYAQVKDTADRIANFLAGKGIKKGDKVAIFLPNLPQFPEILFGILKAGAVAVNCNPIYTAQELNHQLSDSQAKMVFCMDHPEFYKNAVGAIKGTEVETVVVCNIKSYLPKLKGFIGGLLGKLPKADKIEPGHLMFDEVVANAQPIPPDISIDPEKDTAVMLYTGGTTGLPKGAELVHSNIAFNALVTIEWIRIPSEKGGAPSPMREGNQNCMMGVLPWYHSFGFSGTLLVSCALAGKLVCIPDPRAGNPPFTDLLKSIDKNKPTFMSGVPTLFVAISNHPDLAKYDVSSFMGFGSAGSPMPPEVCKEFEEKTDAVIFEAYGLTETAPALAANPTSATTRKLGSIGFPLPNTDIKILDTNDPNRELPRGEDGEIAAWGPQIMKGYWKQPEANEKSFVHFGDRRYFLTGDIGHIDEDGYLLITDRKKDMILVGGFNVYPREVEDMLFTHPKVELVAVVGVPHEKSGEQVKAFLKLREGETATKEEIMAFCKENMAGYKRPRQIEFRKEIPMSNVGKILRRVLRDEELAN